MFLKLEVISSLLESIDYRRGSNENSNLCNRAAVVTRKRNLTSPLLNSGGL
jgi:hypothetical protein